MAQKEIDKWILSCKVKIFPWIDGKQIYCNVQCFAPGQSIQQPPVWDKSVFITDNIAGRRLAYEFTNTLVEYITKLKIPNSGKAEISVS